MQKVSKAKVIRRKKCQGGLPTCKNYIGDYKDVEGVGCCEKCDKYVDENPYDPYWEQMEQHFGDSPEYAELEKHNLVENTGEYEKAFERFQTTYEDWPTMRRRMAKRQTSKLQ